MILRTHTYRFHWMSFHWRWGKHAPSNQSTLLPIYWATHWLNYQLMLQICVHLSLPLHHLHHHHHQHHHHHSQYRSHPCIHVLFLSIQPSAVNVTMHHYHPEIHKQTTVLVARSLTFWGDSRINFHETPISTHKLAKTNPAEKWTHRRLLMMTERAAEFTAWWPCA